MAQWTKGKSGNPRGRPRRGHSLSEILREVGEQADATGEPRQRLLGRRIWDEALAGKEWAARLIFAYVEGLPLPSGVDASDVKIEVIYVQQNSIAIAGTAPSADEGDSGVEAVQRGLCGPQIRKELAGPGQIDSAGPGGEADGLVCTDLPPIV